MGGKALKNVETRRYEKDEFYNVSDNLAFEISKLTNKRVKPILSYKEKETFGDLDILVEIIGNQKITLDKIFSKITFGEKIKNGNVCSFNYNDLQVDLILIPSEEFDFAYTFFSYNDLGLIVGRIARSIGLTYGFDGLKVKICSKYDANNIGEISLTKDPKRAYEILDLDYERWKQGFKNMDEVFEFTGSSKLFSYRISEDSFQNAFNRRRDKKRVNYYLFQEWVNKNKERWPYSIGRVVTPEVITFCDENFPEIGIRKKVQKMYDKIKFSALTNHIFNGRLIMETFPELKGQRLGEVIKNFKNKFKSYEDFQRACFTHGQLGIINMFKEYYDMGEL